MGKWLFDPNAEGDDDPNDTPDGEPEDDDDGDIEIVHLRGPGAKKYAAQLFGDEKAKAPAKKAVVKQDAKPRQSGFFGGSKK